MTMSDPLGDMLTRIRNAQAARKDKVIVPFSKFHLAVCQVMLDEGFVREFGEEALENNKKQIVVGLKYSEGEPTIREISRVSKPGRRIYRKATDIPRTYNGLGVTIVSTSKGVMADYVARKSNLGGEVLCRIF